MPSSPRLATVTSRRSLPFSTRMSSAAPTGARSPGPLPGNPRGGGCRQRGVRDSPAGGPGAVTRPALVNGAAGGVVFREGQPFSVMGFTVSDGKIVEIDILADPERLRELDLAFLD